MPTCIVCNETCTGQRTKYCSQRCQDAAKNRRRKGYPIDDAAYFAMFPPHIICPVCKRNFDRWRKDQSVCPSCIGRAENRKQRSQPIADKDTPPIFYVYGWTDTDHGTFYIGKGKGDRATRSARKKSPLAELARAVAELKGTFAIVYFARDLREREAYDLEARLIHEMQPECNEQHR